MQSLRVNTLSSNYDIYIEDSFENLQKAFEKNNLSERKVCIISDSTVSKLYLNDVFKEISKISLDTYTFVFEEGEESKNLEQVKEIYSFLISKFFDRKSILVALGGGVTGDLVGFVASTYMRGISFVQIPTTLLSQVDSSVGGKVGVDFLGNKNMIGSFYQPSFVYTNISTLKTLDKIQFASGMGEVIKHGLIMDKDYYNFIVSNKEKIKSIDIETLKNIVVGSCKIKSKVVSLDEKEQGIREILNFGHTFGHAVETLSNFTLTHGHCVSIGIFCASYYSFLNNFITKEELDKIISIFNFFDLDNKINDFDTDKIISQMYLDKKTKNNIISIIILKEIGFAESVKISDENILKDCINNLKTIY